MDPVVTADGGATEQPKDFVTQLLDLIGTLIIPDWGAIIAALPVLVLLLVLLALGALAFAFWRAGAADRSRVPRPLTAGAPPPGVHLPGPSLWPFVIPIAATLIFFSLAIRPRNETGEAVAPVNPMLLALGLAVALVGVLGWLRDAGREWRRTDRGEHLALVPASATLVTGTTAAPTPPPGVHLPGPSAWPFFAPLALMFLFFGLVFSPVILVAGLVMAVIAAIAWVRDAGREYHQVEAIGHVEPETRDPARAFPKVLAGIYGVIAVGALVLALAPGLLANLQGGGGGGGNGGGGTGASPSPAGTPSTALVVTAKGNKFLEERLTTQADTPFTIELDNQDAGVPHNVSITDAKPQPFNGEVFNGVEKRTYEVPPLAAGTYTYICVVHPTTMKGTLDVK